MRENCPIRRMIKKCVPIVYEEIQGFEEALWKDRHSLSQEEVDRLITSIENQWKGAVEILHHRKDIILNGKKAKAGDLTCVWSNLLGVSYNPEEFYKTLKEKGYLNPFENLSKSELYFLFWENMK